MSKVCVDQCESTVYKMTSFVCKSCLKGDSKLLSTGKWKNGSFNQNFPTALKMKNMPFTVTQFLFKQLKILQQIEIE